MRLNQQSPSRDLCSIKKRRRSGVCTLDKGSASRLALFSNLRIRVNRIQ
jgi:hypothetical protein